MKPQPQLKPRPRRRFRQGAPSWLAGLLAAACAGACVVAGAQQVESTPQRATAARPVGRSPSRPSDFADTSAWTRYVFGTGVQVNPSGNGVDIDFSPGARSDVGGVTGGYISTFALRGDFTLDVDYMLRAWPENSGVRLGLGIWPSICVIREGVAGLGEEYTFGAGPFSHAPTGDRHGNLRLVRTGGTLSGYYRSSPADAWVLVGSSSGNPVFVQDFQVQVVAWTDKYTFGQQAVGLTLANIAVTAHAVLPGPYGIPSWAEAPEPIGPYSFNGPALAVRPGIQLIQGQSLLPQPLPPNEGAFSRGILEEDLNMDLEAATQSYKSLISQFDTQRPMAANAIFRLGECYRRMGRMDEARVQYNRILREFSDQTVLARLCQRYAHTLTDSTRAAEIGASPNGPALDAAQAAARRYGRNRKGPAPAAETIASPNGPALDAAQVRAQSEACMNNLKEIGISFKIWALDNADQFPFNVSTNRGGTLEFCARGEGGFDQNSFRHFQVMDSELSTPRVLVCPADSSRRPAADFVGLRADNVTYQVRSGSNVNELQPEEVLVRCPIHSHELLCDASVR